MSIVALYNVTFSIRGLPSHFFDTPALTALLSLLFEQHCNVAVECVRVASVESEIQSVPVSTGAMKSVHPLQGSDRSRLLQGSADDITFFVIVMESVLKEASLDDMDQFLILQQAAINRTFSLQSIGTEYITSAINLDSNFINDESSCQFTQLRFSRVFEIHEVSTAMPSISPTPPETVVKSLLLVYIMVPTSFFCLLGGTVIYLYKRRRSALVHARRQQYSASMSYFQDNSHKVRPGAFGYDIENFGALNE